MKSYKNINNFCKMTYKNSFIIRNNDTLRKNDFQKNRKKRFL